MSAPTCCRSAPVARALRRAPLPPGRVAPPRLTHPAGRAHAQAPHRARVPDRRRRGPHNVGGVMRAVLTLRPRARCPFGGALTGVGRLAALTLARHCGATVAIARASAASVQTRTRELIKVARSASLGAVARPPSTCRRPSASQGHATRRACCRRVRNVTQADARRRRFERQSASSMGGLIERAECQCLESSGLT